MQRLPDMTQLLRHGYPVRHCNEGRKLYIWEHQQVLLRAVGSDHEYRERAFNRLRLHCQQL